MAFHTDILNSVNMVTAQIAPDNLCHYFEKLIEEKTGLKLTTGSYFYTTDEGVSELYVFIDQDILGTLTAEEYIELDDEFGDPCDIHNFSSTLLTKLFGLDGFIFYGVAGDADGSVVNIDIPIEAYNKLLSMH